MTTTATKRSRPTDENEDPHWTTAVLAAVPVDQDPQRDIVKVDAIRSMLVDMKAVDLRATVDQAVRQLPEHRLRRLYSALVELGGFDRVIDLVHANAKDGLIAGSVTIADLLRTFECHPNLTRAVIAPLAVEGIDGIKRVKLDAMADGDLDARQIVDMIGELEPGQCVLIVCNGLEESDQFESGILICRIPTRMSFPPIPPIKERFKLARSEVIAYGLMTDATYSALSKDEQDAKKKLAFRAAREDRRYKGAWRMLEMDPPLVPGGATGLWLQWFLAALRVETAHDGEFPEALARRMQNAGLCGLLDGTAEYLVMDFPSPCGHSSTDTSVKISDPSEWIGEEYSTNDGDFDEHDEPDAFTEEATLYKTLEDAVCTLGTIELIAKASRRGVPTEVLFRSKRVDPDVDYITLG